MARREHLTLTATTVGTLPLTTGVTGETVTVLEVENNGATGAAFVSLDGTNPTVDGDNFYRLDPSEKRSFSSDRGDFTAAATVNVKAISSATPSISAEVKGTERTQ